MLEPRKAYDLLTAEFELESGVVVRPDGMYVQGRLFAFFDQDQLVVELPPGRLGDLELRGVAAPYISRVHPTRDWLIVRDQELWPELAREAHEFVGEPAVGGES